MILLPNLDCLPYWYIIDMWGNTDIFILQKCPFHFLNTIPDMLSSELLLFQWGFPRQKAQLPSCFVRWHYLCYWFSDKECQLWVQSLIYPITFVLILSVIFCYIYQCYSIVSASAVYTLLLSELCLSSMGNYSNMRHVMAKWFAKLIIRDSYILDMVMAYLAIVITAKPMNKDIPVSPILSAILKTTTDPGSVRPGQFIMPNHLNTHPGSSDW